MSYVYDQVVTAVLTFRIHVSKSRRFLYVCTSKFISNSDAVVRLFGQGHVFMLTMTRYCTHYMAIFLTLLAYSPCNDLVGRLKKIV